MASSTNGKKNQQESDTEADLRKVNERRATLGLAPLPDRKMQQWAGAFIAQNICKAIDADSKKRWAAMMEEKGLRQPAAMTTEEAMPNVVRNGSKQESVYPSL